AFGTAWVRTMKMPVPMVAPTPSMVSWNSPMDGARRPCFSSPAVSAVNDWTDFFRSSVAAQDTVSLTILLQSGALTSASDALEAIPYVLAGKVVAACRRRDNNMHRERPAVRRRWPYRAPFRSLDSRGLRHHCSCSGSIPAGHPPRYRGRAHMKQ